MSWIVKKALTQTKVTCDEHGPVKVTLKSSFHAKEIERRIRGPIIGVLGQELVIHIDVGLVAQFVDRGSSE